ncbi:MAG: hypothetical protein H0T51_16665 [Pirellulales bacterium]|nr:hypothetical protein [Pirellulales bacterium]
MGNPWIYVVAAAIATGVVLFWRRWSRAQRAAQRERAMQQFDPHRGELAKQFLAAAAATGKPRGLRWKSVDLAGQPVFATDLANGELVALIGATISFEAIEGGDMEDVEAVGNLRSATAVFVAHNGDWTTDGRVIFNLEPAEAMQRFQSALAPVSS